MLAMELRPRSSADASDRRWPQICEAVERLRGTVKRTALVPFDSGDGRVELRLKLESLGFAKGLIIVEAFDMNLWLAARNLPRVDVLEAQLIDPVSLVGADKILISAAALKIIEERLK